MKKGMTVCFIIAGALIALGLTLFTLAMTMGGWNFNMFDKSRYETNTYLIEEDFNDISVNTKTADVVFLPSENDECKVVLYERPEMKHSAKVENQTLNIDLIDTRKWYEHISLFMSNKAKITVYLPKSDYASLLVNTDTGKVKIPNNFTFWGINVSGTTGDVECFASATGTIKIKQSTGDILVEGAKAGSLDITLTTGDVTILSTEVDEDIRISVSTGDTELKNVNCNNLSTSGNTGDESLNNVIADQSLSIKRTTGDVKLTGCDAAEITITTDTGDVSGTLLSEKIFITKSDTGKVKVPDSASGGKCRITTDTGDIKISID